MAFGLNVDLNEKPTTEKVEGKVIDKQPEVVVEDKAEPQKKSEDKKSTEQPTTQPLNEESVLEYINKDREEKFTSLEDLYKTKEVEKIVEKEVNPYDGLLDETDKAYFKYKRETGRSRNDFDSLNKDFTKISALDLAIEKVKEDTGLNLSKAEYKDYIEQKLDIDIDDMSTSDKIELNTFVKSYREQKIQEQEKYRTPLENTLKAKQEAQKNVEMVELEDGRKIPKSDYDKLVEQRETYIKSITEGVNSVTSDNFEFEFGEGDSKIKVDFNYEYSKEDKHSMLSEMSDVEKMIKDRYQSEKGFDHKTMAKELWRGKEENFKKILKSAIDKARADAINEYKSDLNNENFNTKRINNDANIGKTMADMLGGKQSGFGLKTNL